MEKPFRDIGLGLRINQFQDDSGKFVVSGASRMKSREISFDEILREMSRDLVRYSYYTNWQLPRAKNQTSVSFKLTKLGNFMLFYPKIRCYGNINMSRSYRIENQHAETNKMSYNLCRYDYFWQSYGENKKL